MYAVCLLLLHWELCLLHFERGKWGFPAAAVALPAFPQPVQNARTGSGAEQHTPVSIQKASGRVPNSNSDFLATWILCTHREYDQR